MHWKDKCDAGVMLAFDFHNIPAMALSVFGCMTGSKLGLCKPVPSVLGLHVDLRHKTVLLAVKHNATE